MVWDDGSPDYADSTYIPRHPTYEWTWSVSDIINAVVKAGMHLESFQEFDESFYQALPDMVSNDRRR